MKPISPIQTPPRDFPQEEEIYVQGSQAGFGAEAYARGGAAVALGALLAPLAAVAAFIDAGDVKDANCSGLEQQAANRSNAVPPGTRHMPDAPSKHGVTKKAAPKREAARPKKPTTAPE